MSINNSEIVAKSKTQWESYRSRLGTAVKQNWPGVIGNIFYVDTKYSYAQLPCPGLSEFLVSIYLAFLGYPYLSSSNRWINGPTS